MTTMETTLNNIATHLKEETHLKEATIHTLREYADGLQLLLPYIRQYYYHEGDSKKQLVALSPFFNIACLINFLDLNTVCEVGIRLAQLYERESKFLGALKRLRYCFMLLIKQRRLEMLNKPTLKNVTLQTLHTELMSHILRLELRRGTVLKERGIKKVNEMVVIEKQLTRKKENEHIFTRLYDKERKLLEKLEAPISKALYNKRHEEKLNQSFGTNEYVLALMRMTQAFFRRHQAEQESLLKEGMNYLKTAEAYEKQLSNKDLKVLASTEDELIIQKTHEGTNEYHDRYLVAAKKVNEADAKKTKIPLNTLRDNLIVGSGIPLEATTQQFRLSELEPNARYIVHIQCCNDYDELSEAPSQSIEVETVFALPILLCYCYMTQAAFHLSCYAMAHESCQSVMAPYEHVLLKNNSLYESNPTKRRTLAYNKIEAEQNALVIREMIQCFIVMADIEIQQSELVISDDLTNPLYHPNQATHHVRRLEIANILMMAFELGYRLKDVLSINMILEKLYDCLKPQLGQAHSLPYLYDLLVSIVERYIEIIPVVELRKHYTNVHILICFLDLILQIQLSRKHQKDFTTFVQALTQLYPKLVAAYVQHEKDPKPVPMIVSQFFLSLYTSVDHPNLLSALVGAAIPDMDPLLQSLGKSLSTNTDTMTILDTLKNEYGDHVLFGHAVADVLKNGIRQGVTITSSILQAPPAQEEKSKKKKKEDVVEEPVEQDIQPTPVQTTIERYRAIVELHSMLSGPLQPLEEPTDKKGGKKKAPPPKSKKKEVVANENDEPSKDDLLKKQQTAIQQALQQISPFRSLPCMIQAKLNGFIQRASFAKDPQENYPVVYAAFKESLILADSFKQYRDMLSTCFLLHDITTKRLLESHDNPLLKDEVMVLFEGAKGIVHLLEAVVNEQANIDQEIYDTMLQESDLSTLDSLNSFFSYLNIETSNMLYHKCPWITQLVDVKLHAISHFMSQSLKLLMSIEAYQAVLDVGVPFSKLTKDAFGFELLPLLATASEKLQLDAKPFTKRLKRVLRDRPRSDAVLHHARETLGKFLVLYEDAVYDQYDLAHIETKTIRSASVISGLVSRNAYLPIMKEYDVVAQLLRDKHEIDLLIQCLNEYSEMLIFDRDYEKAIDVLREAIDSCYSQVNVIDTFSKSSKQFFKNCGRHRAASGIILCAKLGQVYRQQREFHMATKCAVLISDVLLSFSTLSVEHPDRFVGYVDYELHTDFVPLSDYDFYVVDPYQFHRALQFAAHDLVNNNQYLRSLIVSTNYVYLAQTYLPARKTRLDAKLLKCKALLMIGYFQQSTTLLQTILRGDTKTDYSAIEQLLKLSLSKKEDTPIAFDCTVPLHHDKNTAFIQGVLALNVDPEQMGDFYEPHQLIDIQFILIQLLYALAKTIPAQCIDLSGESNVDVGEEEKQTKKAPPKKDSKKKDAAPSTTNVPQQLLERAIALVTLLFEQELTTQQRTQLVILQCKIAEIQQLFLRSNKLLADALATLNDVAKKSSNKATLQLNTGLLFDVFHDLARMSYHQKHFKHTQLFCKKGLELCESVGEQMVARYFNLYAALANAGMGFVDQAIVSLRQLLANNATRIGFHEFDDPFLVYLCSEIGQLFYSQSRSSMVTSWQSFLETHDDEAPYAKSTNMFTLAYDILDRFLYDHGFYADLVDSDKATDIKAYNMYIRVRETNWLARLAFVLGEQWSFKGNYSKALEYLDRSVQLQDQAPYAHPIFKSRTKYVHGRVHRFLINANSDFENVWGAKDLSSSTYTAQDLENDQVSLAFLPPIKHLESSIEWMYAHGSHDYQLLRSSALELANLYGSKLVDDKAVYTAQLVIAMNYLMTAASLSKMESVLFEQADELVGSTTSFSEKPPTFAVELLRDRYAVENALQMAYLKKQKRTTELDQFLNNVELDARSIISLYRSLRREYSDASLVQQAFLEPQLVLLHKYLLKVCSKYATDCMMTGTPSLTRCPSITHGTVCFQFHMIDSGLDVSRCVKPLSEQSFSVANRQAKQAVMIPMISLLYAIHQDESISCTEQGGSILPIFGMLTFELRHLRKVYDELLTVCEWMRLENQTALPSFNLEEAGLSMNSSIDDATSLNDSQRVSFTQTLRLYNAIEHLLQNSSTAVSKKTVHVASSLAAARPSSLSFDQVNHLCSLFNFMGSSFVDVPCANWLGTILSCYH